MKRKELEALQLGIAIDSLAEGANGVPKKVGALVEILMEGDTLLGRMFDIQYPSERGKQTALGRLLRSQDGEVWGDWRVRVVQLAKTARPFFIFERVKAETEEDLPIAPVRRLGSTQGQWGAGE